MNKIHDDIDLRTSNKSEANADDSDKRNDADQAQSPKLRSRFSVKWEEFVGKTTLHGLRYVFLDRPAPARAIWLIMVLLCGAYYGYIVYVSITKFLSYPSNTVISRKYEKEMIFPAVTFCSLNRIEKSKLRIRDSDPRFVEYGMKQSACVATAKVRGSSSCGIAMVCCCYTELYVSSMNEGGNVTKCTSDYKEKLIKALKDSNTTLDLRRFHSSYGPRFTDVIGPLCSFAKHHCRNNDFVAFHQDSGICITFNSGVNGLIPKIAKRSGTFSAFNIILDSRVAEYTVSKVSVGVKVFIHNQGEFISEWDGINISPGRHAMLSVSKKTYINLQTPYGTECEHKKLKGFAYYTIPGCHYECLQDKIIAQCGCRYSGYEGRTDVPTCSDLDINCTEPVKDMFETLYHCHCPAPCNHTEHTYELSYSDFPSPGISEMIRNDGYNKSLEYQRKNLVYLQVGYKCLSYELQEQKSAFESGALFGEIGGNLGLFLGCSLLTMIELVDFFFAFMWEKYK